MMRTQSFRHSFIASIASIAAVLAFFALTGCQPMPELNAQIQTVPISTQKIDAAMGEVTVQLAPPDQRQSYLPAETQALLPTWEAAATNALVQSQVFTPSASQQAHVRIQIIKVENKHNTDLSISTTTVASYELIDGRTNELLWVRGISSTNTVAYQEATVESTRNRLSLNRSMQSNITQFIQLLGEVQPLYKPVPEQELRLLQNRK